MKPKKGKCIDCPQDAPEKYLTAKRCEFHYKKHRAAVCAAKPKNRAKSQRKSELSIFFASQVLQIPATCENCAADLRYWRASKTWARALVAHILPKRENVGFPAVATHPQNRVFLCPDCHTNYDNLGSDFALKMLCLPAMRARFSKFKHLLTESDMQRVPDYLKQKET